MVNIPHREYWLATEERKTYVREAVFVMMAGIFAGTNVLLAMVFDQLVRFNLGQSSRVDMKIFWLILAVILIFAVAYPLRKFRLKKENEGPYSD